MCKELEALSVSSENYGVIHYDFEPDNVFYDADEDVFCVIDFDDAIRCWYSLDVVRALDALDEVVDENLLKEAEQCFLEGYTSVTELTKEQQQSFPLMRRLVRLQEYATILHVLSEPPSEVPDWMYGLVDKLKYKLCRIEETCQMFANREM